MVVEEFDEWKKYGKIGIFLGNRIFAPTRFIDDSPKDGKIRWKWMRPFSRERTMENINSTILGSKFYLYTNDRQYNTEVQIFNMDITTLKPSFTQLPPSIIRNVELLRTERDALIGENAELRKKLYDLKNQDRLLKEAVKVGAFRKDFIEAGTTGAEAYGYGFDRFRYGGTLPSRFP